MNLNKKLVTDKNDSGHKSNESPIKAQLEEVLSPSKKQKFKFSKENGEQSVEVTKISHKLKLLNLNGKISSQDTRNIDLGADKIHDSNNKTH